MAGLRDAELDIFDVASSHIVALCHDVEDWAAPSTCAGWDAGQLVDHVIGGNWFSIDILAGRSADDAIRATLARFDGTDDRLEAMTTSAADQLASFREPGALEREVDHVGGPMTGATALRYRTHELTIHGWDLGATLDPDYLLDDALVHWSLADLAHPDNPVIAAFDVDATQLARTDLAPHDRLLAAFGRSESRFSSFPSTSAKN